MSIDWDAAYKKAKIIDAKTNRKAVAQRKTVPVAQSETPNYFLQAIKNGPPAPVAPFPIPIRDRLKNGLPQGLTLNGAPAVKRGDFAPINLPKASSSPKSRFASTAPPKAPTGQASFAMPPLTTEQKFEKLGINTKPGVAPIDTTPFGDMTITEALKAGKIKPTIVAPNGDTDAEILLHELGKAIAPDDSNSWGGFMPYNLARGAQALLSGGEGVVDFAVGNLNKLGSAITSLGGTNPNAVSKWFDDGAKHVYDNDIAGSFGAGIEEKVGDKVTGLGKFAGDLYSGAAQLGGTLLGGSALSGVTKLAAPVASKLVLGATAAGNSSQQAYNEGADVSEAMLYGMVSGATEMAVESIAGGLPGLGKGALTSKIFGKLKNTPAALKTLADIVGEGGEEVLSEVLSPYYQRLIYNPEAENATLEELAQAFASGAALSTIAQGGNIANNVFAKRGGNSPSQLLNSPTGGISPVDGDVGGGLPKLSMDDFKSREGSVWNDIDYDDADTQAKITQELHDEMVESGGVVVLSDSDGKVAAKYPDLRDMKKPERNNILKQKITELKTQLRTFLQGIANSNFEFEVNGNILEAKLYNTGINEVLSKLTQDKATMLYQSDEIFSNAKYLYSTPDYDADTNIYRWNYFYTPVQIGEETLGVRIAVRDIANPNESQIYNWGIKREAPLAGGGDGRTVSHTDSSSDTSFEASLSGNGREPVGRSPIGASSDASIDIISQSPENSNNENPQNPTLPKGTGAKEAGFGYEERINQQHSTDPAFDAEERTVEGLRREDSTHRLVSDDEAMAKAQERLDFDYAGEKADLPNKADWDKDDTTAAHLILRKLVADGRISGDYSEAKAWNKMIEVHKSAQGQALQANAQFANTPETIIAEAAEILDEKNVRKVLPGQKARIMETVCEMADKLNAVQNSGDVASVVDLIKQLNKIRRTTGIFSKNTSKQMNWALDKALEFDGSFDFLSDVAAAQIKNIAGDYQRVSPFEAMKNYRIMGMLSKASTVMRNLTSNNIFDPLESLSTNMAVPLDIILSKITGTRTTAVDKSWFSEAKRRGSLEGAVKSFIQVGLDADVTDAQSRYEQRSGRTFKMTGNIAERILSTWSKMENYALLTTDEFQKGGIVAETQRGLDALNADGKLSDDTLLKGRAEEVAKQRTFQNDGVTAKAIVGLRDAANNFALKDKRGGSFGAGDLLMPFARVPANIAAQAANYSPVGLTKGIVSLGRTLNGTLTPELQARAVMDIGRGLNGTAGIAMFAALAVKGIIAVAGADDKDKEAFERGEGRTGTQFNISALGRWVTGKDTAWQDSDTLVSIGFLEPINAQMAAGAFIADAYKEDGTINVGDVINASVSSVVQSVFDLPAMSQINELVNGYRYSSGDSEGERFAEAGTKYLGSQTSSFVVPNFVKGIATATDDTVRNTYSGSFLENTRDSLMSGIPGLRQKLPASLDSFGNERKYTGNPFLNTLNANILPGQIGKFKQNEVGAELERLSEATGSASIYPKRKAPGSIDYGGKNYELTAEQQGDYHISAGKHTLELMQEVISKGFYDRLSDEQKAAFLEQAKGYGSDMAKREFIWGQGGSYKSGSYEKVFKADNAGIDPADYFMYESALERFGEDPTSAESAKAVEETDLTTKYKGELWEIQNPTISPGRNPFTGTLSKAKVSSALVIDVLEFDKNASADKNEKGNPISGSKKSKVLAYAESKGFDEKQIKALCEVLGYAV